MSTSNVPKKSAPTRLLPIINPKTIKPAYVQVPASGVAIKPVAEQAPVQRHEDTYEECYEERYEAERYHEDRFEDNDADDHLYGFTDDWEDYYDSIYN